MTFFSEAEKELTDTEDTKGNSSLMSRRGENSDLSNLRRRERNAAIPVKRRQRIAAKDTPEKQEVRFYDIFNFRIHLYHQELKEVIVQDNHYGTIPMALKRLLHLMKLIASYQITLFRIILKNPQ